MTARCPGGGACKSEKSGDVLSCMRVIERRPATRCSVCHGDLGAEARRCAGCGTTLHVDCDDEVGCPTLGCATRGASAAPGPALRAAGRFSWLRVLLTIVGLAVVGLALPLTATTRCRGPTGRGVVYSNIQMIQAASAMFESDHGRPPRRLEELTERRIDGTGPYLLAPPVDPWGREYHLLPGARGARPVIVTLGADGVAGGEGQDEDVWSDDRGSADR